jgi:hypothetical protein
MPKSINPHFSPTFHCGGGSGHITNVALGRAPRHTVEYACGALGRACLKTARCARSHTRLRRLATKPCEKCGLTMPDMKSKLQSVAVNGDRRIRSRPRMHLSASRIFAGERIPAARENIRWAKNFYGSKQSGISELIACKLNLKSNYIIGL